MASKRRTVSMSVSPTSTDAKSSEIGSEKKTTEASTKSRSGRGGTVVKSRYLQSADKRSKSNSLTSDSVFLPPRSAASKVGDVRRRISVAPGQVMTPRCLPVPMTPDPLEQLGKNILQSTMLDSHCLQPKKTSIKGRTVAGSTAESKKKVDQEKKQELHQETLLLTYLTAKMEHNNRKLKEEAEGRILVVMEEEERLRRSGQEKKRRLLLLEKNKEMNQVLDLQIAALTPVAEAAQLFAEEYRTVATAVDTTRHELPVKNLHIKGDTREFLVKAEASLQESEEVLLQCIVGAQQDDKASVESLREIKMAAQEVGKQLTGGFSELLELSSLVSRATVQTQLSLEEENLGFPRAQELYCPKR